MNWLRDSLAQRGASPAIIRDDTTFTFADLVDAIDRWHERLAPYANRVVALEGDFALDPIAALIALIELQCIAVPLSAAAMKQRDEFLDVSEAEVLINFERDVIATGRISTHPLYTTLRERGSSGLVLFSSGSTGKSKAALHDFDALLEKFRTPRPAFRTLPFLLFDHIGGLNTLFHTLANGGAIVTIRDHNPESVCSAIERHRVELLPASPTFLNLLLLSEEWQRHDLSSLRRITYGTESMPQHVLTTIARALPNVELQQTYGLSELGILRSRSAARDSLWVRVGGEGFETDIRDGVLWIRAQSAMLGYLNADAPFDAEGWFNTGDAVEVDGEYMRIVGRASERINVGGMKVDPVEVESVILEMRNVADVAVAGVPHAITGQAVAARVNLRADEDPATFRRRLREHCATRLPRYKIPSLIEIADAPQFSDRFKKMRRRPPR